MLLTELCIDYLTYFHPLYLVSKQILPPRSSLGASAEPTAAESSAPVASRSSALASPAEVNQRVGALPSDVIQNFTVTMVLLWFIELVDYLFVSHVFALREVWLLSRIVFAVWLQHPFYNGANVVYSNAIRPLLDKHSYGLEQFLERHISEVQQSGILQYLANLMKSDPFSPGPSPRPKMNEKSE